jgi:hypothetical protein
MSDDEAMIAQYLSRGGKVTKCAPGPSDNIVYRSGPRFRRQAKPQSVEVSASPAPAPSAESSEG